MAAPKRKSGMTMQKIAELAGVSRAAVSAVLNNRWKDIRLTEQTRNRIDAVLKKNGFQPHLVGKALAVQRSFVVGMVVEKFNFSFLPEAIEGVEDFTEARGYGLLLMTTRQESVREERVMKYLLARKVDGIILGPCVHASPAMQAALDAQGIPAVLLGQSEGHTRFACVDGFQIGYVGVRHLLERGHSHVACWGMSKWITEGIERAVSDADGKIQITYWPPCSHQEVLDLWFGATSRPTALFANGDEGACKVLNTAIRRGIRVPQELAIVGVDDIPAAAEAVVPLTTISQPKREQGIAAAQLLFDRMEGKSATNVVLQPKLIVRETT